jgi:peptidoglycan/LPS O-acetylase OafA/YrhL
MVQQIINELTRMISEVGISNWFAAFVGLLMHYYLKWLNAKSKPDYTFGFFYRRYLRALIPSVLCTISLVMGLVSPLPSTGDYNETIRFGASTLIGYANTSLWLNVISAFRNRSLTMFGLKSSKRKGKS